MRAESVSKIKQLLGVHWTSFEHVFREAVSSPYALLSTIDAYLLNQPGKQLRPLLALISASVVGTPTTLSYTVAAVVEMVHTASLLHDDVADNADTRRGSWSVQKLFGSQASILLGDFWFARAFQLLLDREGLSLMTYYADAIKGLSEGEMLQLEKAQTLDITLSEYYAICAQKTASLFKAAMVPGALSTGSSQEGPRLAPVFEKAAYHMGMAFQIHDDMLDYQPFLQSGKPAYLDISESKITLPLLGALSNAGEETYRVKVTEWMHQVEKGSRVAITKIIEFVDAYQGLAYAQQVCDAHRQQAVDALSTLPPSIWKDSLIELAGM